MSEVNGKELQTLLRDFAEFRGEMRAKLDGLERNLEDFKKEVRDDFQKGSDKFNSFDERLRAVPDNTEHIRRLEERVTKLEEQKHGIDAEQIKSAMLRYGLPFAGAGGGGYGIAQLFGGG